MAATVQFLNLYYQIALVISAGNGDNGNLINLFTATNGGWVTQLIAVNLDSSNAKIVKLYRGTSGQFAIINIPANSGNSTTISPVNLLTNITGCPDDEKGNKILEFAAGEIIKITCTTSVTSNLIITGIRGEF